MVKLWAMFFLSILLVSVMNFYAVYREPDLVDITDAHEHIRENIKVKGILTSYIIDPYDSGTDRVDLLVEDDFNVIEVRWTETGMRQSGREDGLPTTLPPIGTLGGSFRPHSELEREVSYGTPKCSHRRRCPLPIRPGHPRQTGRHQVG